jgi:penicillin-binding protein 1C
MVKDFVFSLRKRNLKKRLPLFKNLPWQSPKVFFTGLLVVFVFLPLIFIFYITKDLPKPDNIAANAKYSTSVLDRNNRVIYQIYNDKNIIPVTLKEISPDLINATIAIEDKNFYKHQGFSIWGIFRSLLKNVIFRRIEGGGSTITQQLIKNSLLTSEQTILRKIKELILAVELERRYSKDQILEMYLNQTPYGGTAWGVESASQYYFGRHASQLSLAQAAVIAGLPQSPTQYSPYFGSKNAYSDRAKQVLRRMREDKYITKAKEQSALVALSAMKFDKKKASFSAPHFIFYLKDILDEQLTNNALYQKGLVIKSTLDLKLQKKVEAIVAEEIANSKSLGISNAAVVVADPKSGDILAMVGSSDFNNEKFGKFNAALGLRQPGSALKPFTYALALKQNFTAASPIMDVKTEFVSGDSSSKPYTPVNYDGTYHGPVQLRMALGSSINVPAVKVLAYVGIENLLQTLYDAGLSSLAPTKDNLQRFGLSLTLGGGEVRLLDLVGAYTAFANQGTATSLKGIIEVEDFRGKTVYKAKKPVRKNIFTKEVAFIISHILSDNNARLISFGENNYLNIAGQTVAAKTGTTDDKRDNWTIGYSNDLVVGVWVGNNDNSPMNEALASGISGAAPIWRRIFLDAFSLGYKDGIMPKPDKVTALEIDALFGGLPHEGGPVRSEYFISGTEPKSESAYYQKLKISKSENRLANATEIAGNDYDEKLFYVVKEQDPLSTDGRNRFQEGIDNWAKEQGDEKYKPPTELSNKDLEEIAIQVNEPSNEQRIDSNDVRIFAKSITNLPLKYLRLKIGDETKFETKEAVIDTTIHLEDGIYQLNFEAENEKSKQAQKTINIGVNQDPKPTPEPTESPTSIPTLEPTSPEPTS